MYNTVYLPGITFKVTLFPTSTNRFENVTTSSKQGSISVLIKLTGGNFLKISFEINNGDNKGSQLF